MKWKNFKEAVEGRGVNDNTEIDWISFHNATDRGVVVSRSPSGKIVVQDDELFAKPDNSAVMLKRQAD